MVILSEGEKIVKVVRKHWFVMIGFTLGIVAMSLLPIALYKLVFSGDTSSFLRPDIVESVRNFVSGHYAFAYSLWLLFLWIVFFVEWTDYYLDTWIITNKRIIDIEQKGFFHRHVTSCAYNQIQDITVETKGFIATFFKFGTLHVHTAGSGASKTHDDIVIHHADNPEEIRAIIVEAHDLSLR